MDPFFKDLQERLTVKREPSFDRAFWTKFESEFPKRTPWRFPKFTLAFPVPQLAGLMTVLLVVWLSWPTEELAPIQAAELIEKQEFYEMSELLVDIDVASLSEEEWKLLLEEADDS